MIKFSIDDLRETSYADLESIIQTVSRELTRRQTEERDKAIENFKKAFLALRDTGTRVYGIYDYTDQLTFNNWDDFYFD